MSTTLVQCATSAVKKQNSYCKAQFNRIRTRHGAKHGQCVLAASLLTAIDHMLENGTKHHDLGADHVDRRPPRSNPADSSHASKA